MYLIIINVFGLDWWQPWMSLAVRLDPPWLMIHDLNVFDLPWLMTSRHFTLNVPSCPAHLDRWYLTLMSLTFLHQWHSDTWPCRWLSCSAHLDHGYLTVNVLDLPWLMTSRHWPWMSLIVLLSSPWLMILDLTVFDLPWLMTLDLECSQLSCSTLLDRYSTLMSLTLLCWWKAGTWPCQWLSCSAHFDQGYLTLNSFNFPWLMKKADIWPWMSLIVLLNSPWLEMLGLVCLWPSLTDHKQTLWSSYTAPWRRPGMSEISVL